MTLKTLLSIIDTDYFYIHKQMACTIAITIFDIYQKTILRQDVIPKSNQLIVVLETCMYMSVLRQRTNTYLTLGAEKYLIWHRESDKALAT